MTLAKLTSPKNRSIDPWMNSIFDTLFNDALENRPSVKVPAVNISETPTGYQIELAAPGLKKEDFKINLEKDLLSISVEQKTEHVEEGKRFSKKEFSVQSFTRSFNIPESVNTEQIQANYENGILSIELAKAEEEKVQQRTIDVK